MLGSKILSKCDDFGVVLSEYWPCQRINAATLDLLPLVDTRIASRCAFPLHVEVMLDIVVEKEVSSLNTSQNALERERGPLPRGPSTPKSKMPRVHYRLHEADFTAGDIWHLLGFLQRRRRNKPDYEARKLHALMERRRQTFMHYPLLLVRFLPHSSMKS